MASGFVGTGGGGSLWDILNTQADYDAPKIPNSIFGAGYGNSDIYGGLGGFGSWDGGLSGFIGNAQLDDFLYSQGGPQPTQPTDAWNPVPQTAPAPSGGVPMGSGFAVPGTEPNWNANDNTTGGWIDILLGGLGGIGGILGQAGVGVGGVGPSWPWPGSSTQNPAPRTVPQPTNVPGSGGLPSEPVLDPNRTPPAVLPGGPSGPVETTQPPLIPTNLPGSSGSGTPGIPQENTPAPQPPDDPSTGENDVGILGDIWDNTGGQVDWGGLPWGQIIGGVAGAVGGAAGSNTSQTTSIEPWAGLLPYLNQQGGVLPEAKGQYLNNQDLYSPFNQNQIQGQNQALDYGSNLQGQIQPYQQAMLGNVTDTADKLGKFGVDYSDKLRQTFDPYIQSQLQALDPSQMFAESNPYTQSYMDAATRPLQNQLDLFTQPGIRSDARQSGQFGGTRQGIAEGVATGLTNQAIGDTRANIANNAYNMQLQNNANARQQAGQQNLGIGTNFLNAGLDAQARSMAMYPDALQTGMMPANIQARVGDAQQTQSNLENKDTWDQLNLYNQVVGNYSGIGQVQNTESNSNPWLGALGGAMTGVGGYNWLKDLGLFGNQQSSPDMGVFI